MTAIRDAETTVEELLRLGIDTAHDALANKPIPVRFDPTNFWNSELQESDLKSVVETSTANPLTRRVARQDSQSQANPWLW
jgi:hypothetical protein